MDLWQIFSGGIDALLVVCTLVQISPLKINPWSWLAKQLGKAINGEVIEKLNTQGKSIDLLRGECDKREADTYRYRILRFNDEILCGTHHTKEHFEQVMTDIDEYERYCQDHPKYPNNKAIGAIQRIKKTYADCTEKKSFLA